MRMFWKCSKVLLIAALACFVFGFVTEQLWNWLVPAIFGLKAISFWQALGLVLLSKILFGGFHRHGPRRGGRWKQHMRQRWEQRWAQMSPEERERFRAGMRGKQACGSWYGRRGWGDVGQQREPQEQEVSRG